MLANSRGITLLLSWPALTQNLTRSLMGRSLGSVKSWHTLSASAFGLTPSQPMQHRKRFPRPSGRSAAHLFPCPVLAHTVCPSPARSPSEGCSTDASLPLVEAHTPSYRRYASGVPERPRATPRSAPLACGDPPMAALSAHQGHDVACACASVQTYLKDRQRSPRKRRLPRCSEPPRCPCTQSYVSARRTLRLRRRWRDSSARGPDPSLLSSRWDPSFHRAMAEPEPRDPAPQSGSTRQREAFYATLEQRIHGARSAPASPDGPPFSIYRRSSRMVM